MVVTEMKMFSVVVVVVIMFSEDDSDIFCNQKTQQI